VIGRRWLTPKLSCKRINEMRRRRRRYISAIVSCSATLDRGSAAPPPRLRGPLLAWRLRELGEPRHVRLHRPPAFLQFGGQIRPSHLALYSPELKVLEEGYVQCIEQCVIWPPPQLVRDSHAAIIALPIAHSLGALGETLESVHVQVKQPGVLLELLAKLRELGESHSLEIGVRVWPVRSWLHSP